MLLRRFYGLHFATFLMLAIGSGAGAGEDAQPGPKPLPSPAENQKPPVLPENSQNGEAIQGEPLVIEVTGQRSNPRAPESSSTIDRDTLRYGNITRPAGIGQYAPNVFDPDSMERQLPTRAIRGYYNTYFGDPAVLTIQDGVAASFFRGQDSPIFDVEEVRIERGPQNTVRGRGVAGGAYIIQSREPTETWTAEASGRYGSFDTRVIDAAVSGPISDRVLIRLAAQKNSTDGFLESPIRKHDLDFRDSLAGRAELLFRPVKDLEIRVEGRGFLADDGAIAADFIDGTSDRKVNENRGSSLETAAYTGILNFRYDAPGFTLHSITARQARTTDHALLQVDFVPQDLFEIIDENSFTQWSQEIRAESDNGRDRINWRAGFYFENIDFKNETGGIFPDQGLVDLLGLGLQAPVRDKRTALGMNRTYALFGDVDIPVCEHVTFTPGFRLERREDRLSRVAEFRSMADGASVPGGPDFSGDRSVLTPLPSLKIGYDSGQAWKAHVLAASGYRPGGFNSLSLVPSLISYDDEHAWNFEAGMSGRWFGGRVKASANVYYTSIHDFQGRRENSLVNIRVDNAERVELKGFETELRFKPLACLQFDAGLGLSDPRYLEYKDRVTGFKFDGKRLPISPEYTVSLRAQYEHACGFFARGEFSAYGRHALVDTNLLMQNPYQLYNARLGYSRKHFEVYVYGENLADEHYSRLGFPDFLGRGFLSFPGTPRAFGAAITLRY
jgi:iron complex outermembrane recepter protein